jgi:hypothetical protein
VRGRVEDDRRCAGDDDEEGEGEGGAGCLTSYTFALEIEARDATVDDVVAVLERFPPAAGWTASDPAGAAGDAEASFAFDHSCGGGCHALVQLDVFEPERRNRGPRIEVVVTFDDH